MLAMRARLQTRDERDVLCVPQVKKKNMVGDVYALLRWKLGLEV